MFPKKNTFYHIVPYYNSTLFHCTALTRMRAAAVLHDLLPLFNVETKVLLNILSVLSYAGPRSADKCIFSGLNSALGDIFSLM